MPEMNGLDAMIAIRGEFPDARIIVLTTYTGDVQARRALQAGARAYLLKNSLHKELLTRSGQYTPGERTFHLKSLLSSPSMPLKTPCPRWKCASCA